jgi:hypothetical protein
MILFLESERETKDRKKCRGYSREVEAYRQNRSVLQPLLGEVFGISIE